MSKLSLWERMSLIKSVFKGDPNTVTQSMLKFMPMYGEPPKNTTTQWIDIYNKNPRMNPIHQIASDIASAEFEIKSKDRTI